MDLKGLMVFILVSHVGYALIAYDCRGLATNVTAISLRDVAPCPDPIKGYKEEVRRVQIVQKNDLSLVQVKTCLLEITRLIQRCGMFSHTSAVAAGLLTYVKPLGAEECANIHRYKTFKTREYSVESIKGNTTTTAAVILAGAVNTDGKCSGGTYIENGLTWTEVIVSATLKLQIKDYWAPVSLDANEIHLKGGITCGYTSGYCMDTEMGESIWERGLHDTCSKGPYSILYEGIGNFVTINSTDIFIKPEYIVVEQEDRVFALTIIGKSHVCYQDAWVTEHPRLMVVEEKGYGFRFEKEPLSAGSVDLLVYMNTKFMYVEQSFKRTVQDLYINMVYRRCLLHRETLKNRLTLAPLSANSVSTLLKDNPGYIGRVLGEVIYIMQCVPKPVEIRRTTECFNELPVRVDNESLFMAPVTHILQKHGEQIECSYLTPPLYHIDNQWIGFSPTPQVQLKPQILEATDEPQLKFQSMQRLGTGGIYTNQEIKEAQRTLIFGAERRAVTNFIARKIIGLDTDTQGYNTVNLFNEEEIKQLAHNAFRQIWGWFTNFGLLISGMLGFYFVFRIIKYTIGTILNGLSLYHTFGWSFTLAASLWNTLTHWILHRKHRRTSKEATGEADRNEKEIDLRESEVIDAQNVSEVQSEPVKNANPYQHVVIQLKDINE